MKIELSKQYESSDGQQCFVLSIGGEIHTIAVSTVFKVTGFTVKEDSKGGLHLSATLVDKFGVLL